MIKKNNKEEMTLKEFLLYYTSVGDLILITELGWYVGCTIIDHEDRFISSLNSRLLDRTVKSYQHIEVDWINKPIIECDVY